MLDVPLVILAPAIIISLSTTALIFLLLVRRFLLPHLRVKESDSEFVGAVVQSIMVFYGLALALIAVNVWQTYNDVSRTVSMEAITFAALYRDVRGYPEPTRSAMQREIRGYSYRSSTRRGRSCAKGRCPLPETSGWTGCRPG